MVDTANQAGRKSKALPARRRFTVDEYDRMGEHGIFGPDERVQLLDGEIFEMASMGSRHATCTRSMTTLFTLRLVGRALVSCQMPVRLSNGSEPEPDIALLRPRADGYASGHPGPGDVLLIVEVADSSLGFDQERKLPLYAAAGIADFWLVDLTSDHVLAHREPTGGRYQTVLRLGRGDTLAPLAFPDLVLAVADILPVSVEAGEAK